MKNKWTITESEKEEMITALTNELMTLRSKADISQGDLAGFIGVSRQTYGSFERGLRRMTWGTYLSLILFYEFNCQTKHLLHSLNVFPKELYKEINNLVKLDDINLTSFLGEDSQDVIKFLDEQALHSIRSLIMVEYARCTGLTNDEVLKAFDEISFVKDKEEEIELQR